MRDHIHVLALLLVLTVLVGGFFYSIRKPTVEKPGTATLFEVDQKKIQAAEALLDRESWAEALDFLEPMKNSRELKVQLLVAQAQAFSGKPLDQDIRELEKNVGRDRSVELVLRLCLVHKGLKNWKKCAELLRELQKLKLTEPLKNRIEKELWEVALRLGDSPQILAILKKRGAAPETTPEVALQDLQTLRREKRVAEFEEYSQLAEARFVNNPDFLTALARMQLADGKIGEAIRLHEAVLKIVPNSVATLETLHDLYRKVRSAEKAQAIFERLLAEKEDLLSPASQAILLYESALTAEKQGHRAKAYRYLRKAIITDVKIVGQVDNDRLKSIYSWVEEGGGEEEKLFHQMFAAFVDGDTPTMQAMLPRLDKQIKKTELLTDVQRIIRIHQEIVASRQAYTQGELNKLRQTLAAKQAEENSRQLPRLVVPAAVSRPASAATGLAPQGDPRQEKEIQAVKARLREKQRDQAALLAGGSQLLVLGDPEGAKEVFENVLRLKPDLPEGNYGLGKVLRIQGAVTDAVMFAQRAMGSNRREAKFRGLYALLLADQGEFARAEGEARAATEINPRNGEARLALALRYANVGDTERALKEIEIGIQTPDVLLAQELAALKKRLVPPNKE
jgi:tetratricopeptide (TPR) repeat protein